MELSFIVPVYNVEEYIRDCMESIFHQGLDDSCFEVIIINDGSTDNSIETIKDFIHSHKNVTLINQNNQGLSVARNNGIALAKGEYILMTDSDDLLMEYSIKLLLEKAIETKADMVIADFIRMSDEEIENIKINPPKQPPFEIYEKTEKQQIIKDLYPLECYVWRTLFRRKFILDNNITFYPGIYFQDIPFTHECYIKANKTLVVSRLLSIYRRGHDTAASSPNSFTTKKAKDLSIAIAKTWELIHIKDLSPIITKRIQTNTYVLFMNFCYRILHFLKSYQEASDTLIYLNQHSPDLHFGNNIFHKICNIMRYKKPYIYLTCLSTWWGIRRLFRVKENGIPE